MKKDIHKDQLRQLSEAINKHPTITKANLPPRPPPPLPPPSLQSQRLISESLIHETLLNQIIMSLTEDCPVCSGTGVYSNKYINEGEQCNECLGNGEVPSLFGISILQFVKKYIKDV